MFESLPLHAAEKSNSIQLQAQATECSTNSPPRRGFKRHLIRIALLGFTLYHLQSVWKARYSQYTWDNQVNGEIGSVSLSSCPDVEGVRIECGTIVVPKDYFNASAGTAVVAFARAKASKLPRKGSIMINPGGPGGSGKDMVRRFGALFPIMLGPEWDIVGFDPRGIGETKPPVKCFPNTASQRLFSANTVFEQGFTIPSVSNISSYKTFEMLVEQNKQFLSLKEAQANLCAKNMGDELRYMGTATVVRDMDFMTRIFDGDDAKINYWGGSYGSILGAYLVNMIPHRIGFAAIDGIADPVSWANEPSHKWHKGWLSSTEKTYDMFLDDCSQAGPELCPLTRYKGEPFGDIERRIEQFLDETSIKPLPVPFARRPGFLTSGGVRARLLMFLERPLTWPFAAQALSQAITGNGTLLYNSLLPAYVPGSPDLSTSADLSRLAVTCLDSPPPATYDEYPTAEDLAEELMSILKEVSPHFGASVNVGEPDGGCQYWPVKGKGPERFTGPWNASLETPLLIISNTHDPITPIASGLLINSLMPNSSRLLIQKSPGHCSLSMPSLCTAKKVRSYFDGLPPANGTTCDVDAVTFPDSEQETTKLSTMSIEDRQLFKALMEYGKYRPDFEN